MSRITRTAASTRRVPQVFRRPDHSLMRIKGEQFGRPQRRHASSGATKYGINAAHCAFGGKVPENLDFHLPDLGVFIEVKAMHTPRISDQMTRAANVIALQGEAAVRFFAEVVERQTKK